MKKIFTLFLFFIIQKGYCQCPFPVVLSSNGNCTGDSLFVTNSNNSLAKITWYNGANSVSTVSAIPTLYGTTVAGGNGFGMAANQFMTPQGLYLDGVGNIYVSDEINFRIQQFPLNSTNLTNGITVAGGNGNGGASNQLLGPWGICVDGKGNIYIADASNNRIQEWTPGATTGITVAGGNGAGAAANQLNNPADVFVDGVGNIYVADDFNQRVQRFPPGSTSSTNGVTVAGGNGPGAAANQFNGPTDVFVDVNGNLYVTDEPNSRVQKWAPGATSGVTVAGGNGIGASANQLDDPQGIFVDASGNLYIADFVNNRIQKFPPGSTSATNGTTVAGGNGFGSASNQFNGPSAVYVDANGNIYVVDTNNERVQKWAQQNIDTSYITNVPGTYTAVVTNNAGCTVTSNAIVINPIVISGVSISESGNAYCSGTGTFTAAATNGGSGPAYQWLVNGVVVGANSPVYNGVSLSDGAVIKCLMTNNTVCGLSVLDTSNTIIVQAAPVITFKSLGGNCLGDTLLVSSSDSLSKIIWSLNNAGIDTAYANSTDSGITVAGGNGGGAAPNQLFFNQGIYVDENGNLYVVDSDNNRVQKWAPGATSGVTVAGGNGFGPAANQLNGPAGIRVDASGNIYIADYGNFRIQKWAPGATSGITVAGGNGSGSAANQFDFPVGICLDNSGNIYVADNNNNRIQKWAPGATSGITVAGGNGAGPAANQLYFPEDVFVDGAGNIYVMDEYNNRVQKWAPGATSGITVAGGNGVGSAANQLSSAYGLYVDGSGNIYIGDAANNRVQKWAPGATAGITVAGGNGPGFAANQLVDPRFVFVDVSGNVYVSEDLNGRVQKWPQYASIDTIYVPKAPGNYTALVSNASGCSTTSNSIVINPILSSKISIMASDTSACAGSPVSFSATIINGGSNPIVQWQINGTNVVGNGPNYSSNSIANHSIVQCILNSNALCDIQSVDTSNNIVISISNPVIPTVFITVPSDSICSGTMVTFSALSTNGGTFPSYQWQVNNQNVGTSDSIFSYTPINNGDVIDCSFMSNATCATNTLVTSNPISMKVLPEIFPTVNISASLNNICEGTPVTFTAMAINGGGKPQYQWTINGKDSGDNSNYFSSAGLKNGDSINCILISSLTCAVADTSSGLKMTVNPLPTVNFIPDTVYTSLNVGVQLIPITTGNIIQYEWSPAAGLDSINISNPFANPSYQSVYELKVSSDEGCNATGKITVIAGRPLDIPTAFTPNGDGHNDVFRIPPGVQFNLEEFDVFDRWGIKVFSSRDISKGWDGTYNGRKADMGTYVYMISGKNLMGQTVLLKGTVVLIR